MKDGIYFGMSDDDYHAIERLSASGVKNMMVSPPTFWARSWLNENKDADDDNDSKFKLKGRAYHARVVEGIDAFSDRYAYEHDASDYADALISADDLKTKCADYDLKVGGTKAVLAQRIRAHEDKLIEDGEFSGDESHIWLEHMARFNDQYKDHTHLPAAWLHDIEVGAGFIEKHPTISEAFIGGAPEVAILWTYEVDGIKVPMKTKVDRLKEKVIVDFKTYSNPMDMKPARAMARAVANYKYWIQAAVYYKAVDYAIEHGWIAGTEPVFLFVFQGTGDDKMPRARTMPRELESVDLGNRYFELIAKQYNDYLERFGTDPWVSEYEVEAFCNEDFPPWMGD
jgi:hypothetical protein